MFPHERSLVKKMDGRPFALLGVNTDRSLDALKGAQKKHELNFRSWWDGGSGKISKQWRVEALPTLILIDHKGVVRWRQLGVPRNLESMDERIEQLVQEAESFRKSS